MPADPQAAALPPQPAETSATRLILMLGAACFAGLLSVRVSDPFVVTMAEEFAASTDRVALLASAFAVPFALVQPVLGPIGDAIGKRRMVRLSVTLLAVFALAAPFAPDLDTLLVLRALAGIAAGGIMPLSLAAIGDAVSLAGRQVALSRLVVFAISGQIAGGALAGLLAPYLGWRGVFGLCAGVAGAAALLLWLLPIGGAPEASRPLDAAGALRRYGRLMRLPAARLLYLLVLVEGLLVFGCFPWLAPILLGGGTADAAGATFAAGLAVAGFGIGGLVYAAIVGAVLRRLGQARMVVLGGVIAAAGMLGFALAPGMAAFVAAGFPLGLGYHMMHNTIQTRVTEVAPEARGSAVALHACHFYIGQALGPPVIGATLALAGAPAALALAGAGLLVLAMILARS